MNREELIAEISKSAKVTKKEASEVLSATIDAIQSAVKKGDKVTLVGFGTFESRKRAARIGRNPQTGKAISITNVTATPIPTAWFNFFDTPRKGQIPRKRLNT